MCRTRGQCTARTNSVTPPESRATRTEGRWEAISSETEDCRGGVVQFVGSLDKNHAYDGTDDELSARLTDTELEGFSSAEEEVWVSSDEEVSRCWFEQKLPRASSLAWTRVLGFCTSGLCLRGTKLFDLPPPREGSRIVHGDIYSSLVEINAWEVQHLSIRMRVEMLLREARTTEHTQQTLNGGTILVQPPGLEWLQVRLKRRILALLGATHWLRGGHQEIVVGTFMARVQHVPTFEIAECIVFFCP